MGKYFLVCVLFCLFFFVNIHLGFAECGFNGSVEGSLEGCLNDTDLVDPGDGRIEGSIKQLFVFWTNALVGLLALISVGAIVFGGLMMAISVGEEEKIKKGKDIIKWALIGFVAMISAGAIVRLVIEVIFSVAS